jgi:DNA-3-methyladenine glycosylase II
MYSDAVNHFQKVDPVLYNFAITTDLPEIAKTEDYFLNLCDAIVSQQLSIKAAATIFGRFKLLFVNEVPTPETVIKLTEEQLRAVGLSRNKALSVQDLAAKVLNNELELDIINKLSDAEILTELVKVRGIGRWTAEMFLIFTLGRPDVFSPGDLGLKKGIEKLYKLKSMPEPDKAEKLAAKWSPYKSYASRLLWKYLTN